MEQHGVAHGATHLVGHVEEDVVGLGGLGALLLEPEDQVNPVVQSPCITRHNTACGTLITGTPKRSRDAGANVIT